MTPPIRVALFTDAYEEPNGVASLSREYAEYSRRKNAAMLVVRGGRHTTTHQDGSLRTLLLKRGLASFRLDQDLYCDPVFVRHLPQTMQEVQEFAPDVVHITGPGDMGILGARIAHLCRIPLVASWHTNLHEYAAKRIRKGLSLLPGSAVAGWPAGRSATRSRHYCAFTRLRG